MIAGRGIFLRTSNFTPACYNLQFVRESGKIKGVLGKKP